MKTARFVRWHHSLPTFGSDIALSARMSATSFADFPRCAFTLTRKVAVPAAILFRSILMAAARISASGAPTNVAFPPSPIHLFTAFNNDWLSHKYSNGSSISVSRSARKNAANSGRFELEPSSSLHCCFSFLFSNHYILLPFCPFCLNRHLLLLGPKTHSLQACLSLCPSVIAFPPFQSHLAFFNFS